MITLNRQEVFEVLRLTFSVEQDEVSIGDLDDEESKQLDKLVDNLNKTLAEKACTNSPS